LDLVDCFVNVTNLFFK